MRSSKCFITNLFRTFDPRGLIILPLNWSASIIRFLILPPLYWLAFNKLSQSIITLINMIRIEFRIIFGELFFPGISFLTTSLFIWIGVTNFFGLFPYIFTPSSHLVFTLALALPLWIGHIRIALVKNFNSTVGHFVPLSTPIALAPFIVLIELIRRIIRPFTLAVRLAANIIAGHLLLTLLRSAIISQSWAVITTIFLPLFILVILEMAVRLIQAYVFSLLRTLYLNEVRDRELLNYK